ncbi:MAG: hypothetical protein JWP57_4534 [Spirosoma sp.]|nr:hypothetical protein [Spirosoma sp.]
MTYVPYATGTLFIPSGPGLHLFVLVTDRCLQGSHLLVSFSSVPDAGRHDATCLVDVGEHDFVKRPSFMVYRLSHVDRADRLSHLVGQRYYRAGQIVSEELLARIREGIGASPFTPQRIVSYFNQVMRQSSR